MDRVRYVPVDEIINTHSELRQRLLTERKVPTANLFLAMLNVPDILDAFLTYANAIRASSISPKLREMAILVVGHCTGSEYEIAHHHSHALNAGLSEEQYQATANFESSALFSLQEKAVMAFAKASTLHVNVDQAIWDEAAKYLSEREMIELAMNVAWYNSGVRIMGALGIELEDSYRKRAVAV